MKKLLNENSLLLFNGFSLFIKFHTFSTSAEISIHHRITVQLKIVKILCYFQLLIITLDRQLTNFVPSCSIEL